MLLATVFLAGLAPLGSAASWQGTVTVEGFIREPEGYHPYKTRIDVLLSESGSEAVGGATRVTLVSRGSVYHVQTEVHQSSGQLICTGTASETLTGVTVGYLESSPGRTTYHLFLPRTFGAFACGTNRAIRRDRTVLIGRGDHAGVEEVETADSEEREVAPGGILQGSFHSRRSRPPVSYEYDIRWLVKRAGSGGAEP